MNDTTTKEADKSYLIRLGGMGIFLSMVLYVLINFVIKRMPEVDLVSAIQLKQYLTQEADTWAVVHGLRYIALFAFAVFAAGFFARVRGRRRPTAEGWEVLGLIGTAALLATGLITNSIETLLFFDHPTLSGHPDLFWMLFYVTRFVFGGAPLAWGTVMLGFSLAGWSSGTLPKWMVVLGVLAAAAGVLHAVFLVSAFQDGWASWFSLVAVVGTLLWGVCVGVLMMLRGAL